MSHRPYEVPTGLEVFPVEIEIDQQDWNEWEDIEACLLDETKAASVLRWSIADAVGDEILVEATVTNAPIPEWREEIEFRPGEPAAIQVVPTGVGCRIGGYAGDAGPATSLLASTVDHLITHPNAVNASDFVARTDNLLYCEGALIDGFCRGQLEFYPTRQNRIGLIVETADRQYLDEVAYVVDACRAVRGVNVQQVEVTSEQIGAYVQRMSSGSYSGALEQPNELIDIASEMVESGITAIAVCSKLRGVDEDNRRRHFQGKQPNPIGGLEASISHLLTRYVDVPVAHAPIHNVRPGDDWLGPVDARGAGEVASRTGLGCVLIGLQNAPQVQANSSIPISEAVTVHQLQAVVAPATSLGGIPMLTASERNIPIIAVRDNQTVNNATREALGLENVVEVQSYLEAAGVLTALQNGISIDSLRRPLNSTVVERSQQETDVSGHKEYSFRDASSVIDIDFDPEDLS